MVDASITKYGYVVSGHADYDEYGYDIVCSAISALTQTIAISLKKYCKAKIEVISGGVVVELSECSYESMLLLNTLMLGLIEIQDEYPKHLKVRIQKGWDHFNE